MDAGVLAAFAAGAGCAVCWPGKLMERRIAIAATNRRADASTRKRADHCFIIIEAFLLKLHALACIPGANIVRRHDYRCFPRSEQHAVFTNQVSFAAGYASSSAGPTHFGLGPVASASLVEIRWPSGVVQEL